MDDDWLDFPVILGQGALHDLSDADPRNPRLIGFKSVSYSAACSIRKPEPKRHSIGFHIRRK
jgi:hypothetical protein